MPLWKQLLSQNALSFVALLLFLLSLVGHVACGLAVHNEEALEHGEQPVSLVSYLGDSHFGESLFENWESEFLQVALFVVLTAYLKQKGSSESKPLEGEAETDEDPRTRRLDPEAPWPVKRGGLLLRAYEHSLGAALLFMFFVCFTMHALTGHSHFNAERVQHGKDAVALVTYVTGAQFWFESFQNWQSEFLAVATLIILSIFLRERGSAQSKRVAAPHAETGEG